MLNVINFLASIPVFERLTDINLNWIGNIIKWLVEFAGSIGIGIILFTLALKIITSPLDAYSKASMRKNSLKMERMRPQLEKLKKQYANDKAIYNQKMMALYKKEGYSMFGACLPTIVTLVFFIIVLNAFQDYSKYATMTTFNDMRSSYTSTVKQYAGEDCILDSAEIESMVSREEIATADEEIARSFIINKARQASAVTFRKADIKFLWVKNIWISDSALSHPVMEFSKFKSTIKLAGDESFTESAYDELTFNMAEEKKEPNGFFIFIVLSVAVTLLSQWVLGKSQKAQLELQSVDGQGMQTQKMMMYILPVMIGFFAFMYTSAFCIYMVSNSFLTILTTLLINKIVDVKFKHNEIKQETQKLNNKYNRVESSKYKKN